MIRRVSATVFNHFMTTGRTSPMLISCEPEDDKPTDYVVKLMGGMDLGKKGSLLEVIASKMASQLGISCPEPALILLTGDFVEMVAEQESEKAAIVRRSQGWNFGSELMKDISISLVDPVIPASMIDMAATIFAFDALIQNPDRKYDNPNLVTQGDVMRIFDHECAFSFWNAVPKPLIPWELGSGDYLEKHVLRNALKHKAIDWSNILKKLQALTPEFFTDLRQEVPQDWDMELLEIIEQHVLAVAEHAPDFELELRRRIA